MVAVVQTEKEILGTELEDFVLNVVEYLQRQEAIKEAQAKADEVKAFIKAYMEKHNLTEEEAGDRIVKLTEKTRQTVNTKIAKVVIPKKYLEKEGVLTTTTYQELSFTKKK
jgi:hypothetical protein